MIKILAVSGGIDSMVMLHMFRNDDIIVAHFNHGIRSNSDDDEDFVRRMAAYYGKKFISKKANLSMDCSEKKARLARYSFLFEVAKEYGGELFVAHHQDDIVESIAINLLRGTGWRGLTPMYNSNIRRPLLKMTKKDIFDYAVREGIIYREDPTNNQDSYLRNRIRFKLRSFRNESPDSYQRICGEIIERFCRQNLFRQEIEALDSNLIQMKDRKYDKALFTVDDLSATELLRYILEQNRISLTRPQLERALMAIRELGNGKKFSLNKDCFLEIGKYYIYIRNAQNCA